LVYNAGIIAGGAIFGRALGVAALAWGALVGAALGPFLIQVVAAYRAGLRYRPSFVVRHPDFVKWLKLSLPLMIGVGLVTADDWIVSYFAAAEVGAISCLNYARKLVMVPIAIAGQAVGQASMPFFARLYAEGRRDELARLVTRSTRASASISALTALAMIAVATPIVELLFRHGRFSPEQVAPTARYLQIFAMAIPLWGAQGILARAFYAGGDTLTPMVASTAVTLLSLPIYWAGFHSAGVDGLVVASGVGMLLHTAGLLWLLPRRLPGCQRASLVEGVGRAIALGALAAAPAHLVARALPDGRLHGMALLATRILTAGTVFGAVALLLARTLKVDDLSTVLDRLLRRTR
jgi:putative peptidoglycan lipid II flippase